MIVRIEMEHAIEGDLPVTLDEYQKILDNELDKVHNALASVGIYIDVQDAELIQEN